MSSKKRKLASERFDIEPPDPGVEKEIFCIKKCLASFVKNDKVLARIRDDVRVLSPLITEASMLISSSLTDILTRGEQFPPSKNFISWAHFRVAGKKLQENVAAWETFQNAREFVSRSYNLVNRNELFAFAVRAYETRLQTNITTHAYNRIFRYYKFVEKLKPREAAEATSLVFKSKEHHLFPGVDMTKLDKNWWDAIPGFFKLALELKQANARVFTLFPLMQPGAKHLTYDVTALRELLRITHPKETPSKNTEFASVANKFWLKHFHVDQYVSDEGMIWKNDKSFRFSIQTDGVAVSISMQRRKVSSTETKPPPRKRVKKTKTPTDESALERQIDFSKYERILGVDPGIITCASICSLDVKTKTFSYKEIKSKRLRAVRRPTHTERSATESFEKELEQDPNKSMKPGYDWRGYLKVFYRHFEARLDARLRHSASRRTLDAWIVKRRTLDRAADEICSRNSPGRTLINWGDGSVKSGIKYGHRKPPLLELVRFCRRKDRGADLRLTDESFTTQTCSSCWSKISFPNKIRSITCQKCNVRINRDENAARNILHLALLDARPSVFSGSSPEDAKDVDHDFTNIGSVGFADALYPRMARVVAQSLRSKILR